MTIFNRWRDRATRGTSTAETRLAALNEALDALEADHAFLTKDGVFSESFISGYIEAKRAEAAEEAMHPTPHEFFKYFDV